MNGFRDIEQLSAYLDGQLSPSDSARLESRLKSDPQLASAYEDIRSARGVLRKLPMRKAPRNFTLTRKMVGLKPPLPRAYPTFRFATAFATILFALTVAVNTISPRVAYQVSIPNYGMGGGCAAGAACGGGGPDTQALFSEPAATEAPVAEAPAEESMDAAMAAPMPTEMAAADTERIGETPTPKEQVNPTESQNQPTVQREAFVIPAVWQYGLLGLSLTGALILFALNQFAKRKWQ
jgi:hypothetical protein